LACQDKFLVNKPLDIEENEEHALDLALLLNRLFGSALNRECHSNTRVRLMFSSPISCPITVRISVALFPEICTKFDVDEVIGYF
jgi:hypothetical protein